MTSSPVVEDSIKVIIDEGDNIMYSIVVIKYHYVAGHFEGENFIQGEFTTSINLPRDFKIIVNEGSTESFLEQIKVAFREKRFIVREWSYDGKMRGGIDGQIMAAKQTADQALGGLQRWCQAHFGEVYNGWIHLKVIRGFVESVLRYGLPVNFVSMFIEPVGGKEKVVSTALVNSISQLRPELALKKALDGDDDEEDETENLPFVCQKFSVIGASSVSS